MEGERRMRQYDEQQQSRRIQEGNGTCTEVRGRGGNFNREITRQVDAKIKNYVEQYVESYVESIRDCFLDEDIQAALTYFRKVYLEPNDVPPPSPQQTGEHQEEQTRIFRRAPDN